MGLIKEPETIDIFIPPHKVSEKERQLTIEAIAASKAKLSKPKPPKGKKFSLLDKVAVL
jgi:hypothetical protein